MVYAGWAKKLPGCAYKCSGFLVRIMKKKKMKKRHLDPKIGGTVPVR
jgi:hypothetical protein